MSEFKVESAALEVFAQTSDRRRSDFNREVEALKAAELGWGSFGYIPGVGNRIHTAYEKHVESCADGVASAAEAMAAIASGVRAIITNYQSADDSSKDGVAAIHRQLDDVKIRGQK